MSKVRCHIHFSTDTTRTSPPRVRYLANRIRDLLINIDYTYYTQPIKLITFLSYKKRKKKLTTFLTKSQFTFLFILYTLLLEICASVAIKDQSKIVKE